MRDKIDYKGFIFIGLMNCEGDPYVVEYNVRMGDPETEAVLPRIKSDFLSHLVAAAQGKLSGEKIVTDSRVAMTIVAVSGGYPEDYKKGYLIKGLEKFEQDNDILLFHSGTKVSDGHVVTSGGRVLALTTLAPDIHKCRQILYKEIEKISFNDIYFRKDIGLDLMRYSK
ncbi:MAG TPA: hypothetical protein DEO33_01765 [Rikenellaceae bacterium]|nr:hypothetical protein [Rikenellaceae bacterium]